jgi:hypothetical protein
MSLESGPFMTMVTLGLAGFVIFPWQALIGALLTPSATAWWACRFGMHLPRHKVMMAATPATGVE